jgi:hypothetical protein
MCVFTTRASAKLLFKETEPKIKKLLTVANKMMEGGAEKMPVGIDIWSTMLNFETDSGVRVGTFLQNSTQ